LGEKERALHWMGRTYECSPERKERSRSWKRGYFLRRESILGGSRVIGSTLRVICLRRDEGEGADSEGRKTFILFWEGTREGEGKQMPRRLLIFRLVRGGRRTSWRSWGERIQGPRLGEGEWPPWNWGEGRERKKKISRQQFSRFGGGMRRVREGKTSSSYIRKEEVGRGGEEGLRPSVATGLRKKKVGGKGEAIFLAAALERPENHS